MHPCRLFVSVSVFLLCFQLSSAQTEDNLCKPWTYWWWMGNGVSKSDIEWHLNSFSRSGIGGVHIIPIYGVKGYEHQFLSFLSEDWLEYVQFTIAKAGEMNIGVDLTLGTGWPYGGPWINRDHAAKKLVTREYDLKQTRLITARSDSIIKNNRWLDIVGIYAANSNGERIDLSNQCKASILHQEVSFGNWKLILFGITGTNQQVKRAAPGDEGLVMDYFDEESVKSYLFHFDSVFTNSSFTINPRAYYHDSYEVSGADWTYDFSTHFREHRGYNLNEYLPLLTDTVNPCRPFLIHDIRETIDELIYSEFTSTWTTWCRNHQTLSRNQAHGSPGNILDMYALSDIPETESFGCSLFDIPNRACDPDYEEERFGRPSPLMMKFASSPAHLTGKPLVSSETGTWLANHFKVSLNLLKPQIDELFISGINHIFYHGITYSPSRETFPGWLFYASTNFGQFSHFWEELPLLNKYIEECQNLLQNSSPDNDILLYFPVNDLWTKYEGNILLQLDVHHYDRWFDKTGFGETASMLWENGYTFDYISDRQVNQLQVNPAGKLAIKDATAYSLIIIPPVDYIKRSTLKTLDSLALKGAEIIFVDKFPESFSGLMAWLIGDTVPQKLKNDLTTTAKIVPSNDLPEHLNPLNIRAEKLKRQGLDFIRKRTGSGYLYFITNSGNRFYEDSIELSAEYDFVEIFDPQGMNRGYVPTSGRFFLQLLPGKSCFIRTLSEKPKSQIWQYFEGHDTTYLENPWEVRFITGNNQNLKTIYTVDSLRSWTEWGDDNLKSFCGKASYISHFTLDKPNEKYGSYHLVFDDIKETAAVTINGVYCGTIWASPFQLEIPATVLKRNNRIEIIVQNLSANRIKQMDAQHIHWKKFYDINFVDIRYRPFDASGWGYVSSGIIGDVMLIGPLQ